MISRTRGRRARRGHRAGLRCRSAPACRRRASASIAAHVVDHVAVRDRARAAGVVARHAAERGLRAGGHVDREPQAVRLQLRVERVEHDAGLHDRPARRRSNAITLVEVLAACRSTSAAPTVWPHWLVPAPRGSTGTRSSRAIVDRRGDVLVGSRHEHADRLDLVDRRVGRVAAARGGVEQHLAARSRGAAGARVAARRVGRDARAGGRRRLAVFDDHASRPAASCRPARIARPALSRLRLSQVATTARWQCWRSMRARRAVARRQRVAPSPRAPSSRASTCLVRGWSGSAALCRRALIAGRSRRAPGCRAPR